MPLLTKYQKNTLFTLMEGAGVNPRDFKLDEREDSLRIACNEMPQYYAFFKVSPMHGSSEGTMYRVVLCPGKNRIMDNLDLLWRDIINSNFAEWAKSMKRELEEPDLWSQLEQHKPPLRAVKSTGVSSILISKNEAKEIVGRLQELEAQINQKFQLEAGHKRYVKQEFEYLRQTAESGRLTGKDWKLVFLSTMMGIATTLAMNPQQTKVLWHLVQSIMSTVAGILPPAP